MPNEKDKDNPKQKVGERKETERNKERQKEKWAEIWKSGQNNQLQRSVKGFRKRQMTDKSFHHDSQEHHLNEKSLAQSINWPPENGSSMLSS